MRRYKNSSISRLQYEEQLAKISEMRRKGYTLEETAAANDICYTTVCKRIKTLKRRYARIQMDNHGELVKEKLSQLAEIRKEAWKAWEKSKEDMKRLEVEKVPKSMDEQEADTFSEVVPNGFKVIKRKMVKQGRIPANDYLQTILKTLQDERDLLGLDEAKKIQVENIDWEAIVEQASGCLQIEQEIESILCESREKQEITNTNGDNKDEQGLLDHRQIEKDQNGSFK